MLRAKSYRLGGRKSTGIPSTSTGYEEDVTSQKISIDAEEVAAMDLDEECILERSRVVSIVPASMPYAGVASRYNKRWYVDIVALPDNAIRVLLTELFSATTAAHRLALDMTARDFETYYFEYFAVFAKFAMAVLAAEESVLYTEVDSGLKKLPDYSTHALNPSHRLKTKTQITDALMAVLALRQTHHDYSSVTIVNKCQLHLGSFARLALEYFGVKESVLPRILVKGIRGAKEKTKMESKLMDILEVEGGTPQFLHSALLAVPLNSEAVRNEFEERHFSRAPQRAAFRGSVEFVETAVLAIPIAFVSAAETYRQRFSVNTFLDHYGKDRDADETTELIN